MPASVEYTDIRLMRGSHSKVSSWKPNPGEPVFDLDNYILSVGDGATIGGVPINAMTSKIVKNIYDLNYSTTIGRFFISEGMVNQPLEVNAADIAVLEVLSSDVGGFNLFQQLYILTGDMSGHIFTRISETQGQTWSDWNQISGINLNNNTGTGTSPGDTNLNNYVLTSQIYIENMVNGPDGSIGANGILITYRPNELSNYIYQILYIVSGTLQGKIYYRFSVNKNLNFESPGYSWVLLDLRSISTTPTPNFIPRANVNGKINIGWLETTSELNTDSENILVTAKAVYNLNDNKSDKNHTHTLESIESAPDANVYNNSKVWDNGAITHIYMSTTSPSQSDGKDGDIWFQYV